MLGLALYYVYPVLPKSVVTKLNPTAWFSLKDSGEAEVKPTAAPEWQAYSDAALAAALRKPISLISLEMVWS